MSGTGLSRVRTELRLLLPERINQGCSRREEPTLLCNQVLFGPRFQLYGKRLPDAMRIGVNLCHRNPTGCRFGQTRYLFAGYAEKVR
jgi:hypothetical protein